MTHQSAQSISLALFCKVVDNYGDIGICWRLARQLQHEHGVAVTLWVDDLNSFQRICPEVVADADIQHVAGVTVRHWRDQEMVFSMVDISDIVIEFFACDIPPAYIDAMAQCDPKPVWLNLEGLTAEEWVEGCHMLPSSHPRLPLIKHFFFPGFTEKTGGLLHEASLDAQRQTFQSDHASMAGFLSNLGVTSKEMAALKVSLFCYAHAPVTQLFEAWQKGETAITCLVPEGVATQAVRDFFGEHASEYANKPATEHVSEQSDGKIKAGMAYTRDALTVRILPFIAQPNYDRLLWACDLNFVRGEDSFVRAQWANRPFIWHIYPQDENLHHKKLRAFLQRYAEGQDAYSTFSLCWNAANSTSNVEEDAAFSGWHMLWGQLLATMPKMTEQVALWQQKVLKNGDFSSNLLYFAESLHLERLKKSV